MYKQPARCLGSGHDRPARQHGEHVPIAGEGVAGKVVRREYFAVRQRSLGRPRGRSTT